MIHASLRMVTTPTGRGEVLAILCAMAARTRAASGCITCRVYRDAQENDALMMETIWKSEADLNRHLRSEEFRNILLAVEMAVEQPEIRFETVSRVNGLEVVEKARTLA